MNGYTKEQLVEKMTRAGADVVGMELDRNGEYVVIQFEGGTRIVQVGGDD